MVQTVYDCLDYSNDLPLAGSKVKKKVKKIKKPNPLPADDVTQANEQDEIMHECPECGQGFEDVQIPNELFEAISVYVSVQIYLLIRKIPYCPEFLVNANS